MAAERDADADDAAAGGEAAAGGGARLRAAGADAAPGLELPLMDGTLWGARLHG
jgi:hypothetical protein